MEIESGIFPGVKIFRTLCRANEVAAHTKGYFDLFIVAGTRRLNCLLCIHRMFLRVKLARALNATPTTVRTISFIYHFKYNCVHGLVTASIWRLEN